MATSLGQLQRAIQAAAKEQDAANYAATGIDSILHVVSGALEGTESGWVGRLKDSGGQPLFSEKEAAALEPKLGPMAAYLQGLAVGRQQGGTASASASATASGIDEMYEGFLKQLTTINQSFLKFAKDSGILHMELASDLKQDIHPFGPVGALLGPEAIPIAQQIPMPLRLIVFLSTLSFEVLRILTAMPGFDVPILRKLLAVVASALDILRGDWKKALMSFAGFFEASYVWMGFLGKVFLEVFYMIAPNLQANIGWGTLSIGKSILIGGLLNCFQLFAPYEVRKQVYIVFNKILDRQICVASQVKKAVTKLKQEGGSTTVTAATTEPEATATVAVDNRLPDSTTPNRLQNVLSQPSTVCSDEVQQIISVASLNIFLKIALQLMNIPTTLYGLEQSCKKLYDYAGSDHTWRSLLIAEGAMDYVAPDRDKSQDTPSDEEALPHNKVKQLKQELATLKATEQTITTVDIPRAEQALVDASNNPLPETTLKEIIQTLFPSSMITHTFKEFDYETFVNVMNYVIQVNYTNKDIKAFTSFKTQVGWNSVTDDEIMAYTQTLYEILDTPDYSLIHEKLFQVNRLLNAIKRREWGLVSPTLKSIESDVKELYAAKAKAMAIQKATDALQAVKEKKELTQQQIETKLEEIVAASTDMVDHTDALASETEAVVIKAKEKTLANSSKLALDADSREKEAARLKKEAEIEAEVQKRLAVKEPLDTSKIIIPTPPTSLGIASAVAKSVSNVLGRVVDVTVPTTDAAATKATTGAAATEATTTGAAAGAATTTGATAPSAAASGQTLEQFAAKKVAGGSRKSKSTSKSNRQTRRSKRF